MAYTKPSDINSLWAASGTKVAPETSKRSLGWIAEKPSWQYFNSILNRIDTYMAYSNERGISEWDSTTEYLVDKSYVVGSNGYLYKARTTQSGNDPVIDGGVNWRLISDELGAVTWNANYDYLEGAVVYYSGRVWIATEDNTNITPNTSNSEWDSLVLSSDLGTAASADLTTSDTSFEDGAVVQVGNGGLFSDDGRSGTYIADWSSLNVANYVDGEVLWGDNSSINDPAGVGSPSGAAIVRKVGSTRAWIDFTYAIYDAEYTSRWSSTSNESGWLRSYTSRRNATPAQINTGTSTDTVVTPAALTGAGVLSDSVKAGLYSISSITPTLGATQTNNTDYDQEIYFQFPAGTGGANAIEMSNDLGSTWFNVGYKAGAAAIPNTIIVHPSWSWRVNFAYSEIVEVSA